MERSEPVKLEVQIALSNHLILKDILKHHSVADLLQFSLVSSFWNSCARTVLRDQKKCVAFIRRDRMCLDLKELNDVLGNSVNIPYNGISILSPCGTTQNNPKDLHNHIICDQQPSTFYSHLLEKLNCKYIDIKLWTRGSNSDCPGRIILNEIFQKSASKLEGLSITGIGNFLRFGSDNYTTIYSLFGFKKAKFKFPKLKYLEVPEKSCAINGDATDDTKFTRNLIEASPNVKVITGGVSSVHLKLLTRQNTVSAVKEFNFYLDFGKFHFRGSEYAHPNPALQDILNNCLMHSIKPLNNLHKLTKLSMSTSFFEGHLNEDSERWLPLISQIYSGLLSNNKETLQELHIYHLDLILLSRIHEQIQPLIRLESITLYCVPELTWTLRHFNYSKLFPNVSSVTFICDFEYQVGEGMREGEEFYLTEEIYKSEPLEMEEYQWPSVKAFKYICTLLHDRYSQEDEFDPNLVNIFPNATDWQMPIFRNPVASI